MIAAIRLSGLGKRYRLGESAGGRRSLPQVVGDIVRRPQKSVAEREVWALQDVTLEIVEGRAVGLIGENGAGKSTLLKVLSKVTPPTVGHAEVRGRVGALLEVGTGFNPDFTGRENVYFNAAVLGMTKRETRKKFDDIVSFAGVGRFIDTPMKRFSSGMYLRLAFAVAAHVDPEILLLDEVLAVGDAAFQRQCLARVGELLTEGRTIILVSHNLATIESVCDDAIVLHGGRLLFAGPASEGLARYRSDSLQWDTHVSLAERIDRQGDGRVRFVAADILSGEGVRAPAICGGDLTLVLEYEGTPGVALRDLELDVDVETQRGHVVTKLSNVLAGQEFAAAPEHGYVRCVIPRLPLTPGRYVLGLRCTVGGSLADDVRRAVYLDVSEGDFYGSGILPPRADGELVLMRSNWSLEQV